MEAARALGATRGRLIGRHLLPNVLPPLLVYTSTLIVEPSTREQYSGSSPSGSSGDAVAEVAGVVEHVTTGEKARFLGVDTIGALIVRILPARAARPAPDHSHG